MNQFDSYKSSLSTTGRNKTYFEQSKSMNDSYEQYKSISSNNSAKKFTWNQEASTSHSPLFIKAPQSGYKNKIQIKFLKDSDTDSTQQTRLTLYGTLLKTKTHDFISHSQDNFSTSKYFRTTDTKRNHVHYLQSKPNSALANKVVGITNLTIKQNTIDMSQQLQMIPEVNENNYILGEKAKLIAKLIERGSNSNLKFEHCLSAKKKPSETSSASRVSLCQLKNLDLNLDLEKNLRQASNFQDESFDFSNNFTSSYPNLSSNSCFFKTQNAKFNTKLDRQFRRVTPNTERSKKVTLDGTSRAKSSKNISVKDDGDFLGKKVSDEQPHTTNHIKGTSIKLKFPSLNKEIEVNSVNSENNKNIHIKNSVDNHFSSISLVEFT